MIIIREVFTAKPGQASKLAKLFKKTFMGKNDRVMTDMVGPYNTVVVEREMSDLAAFQKEMDDYAAGKMPDMNLDPEVMEQMKHYTDMYMEGRREIYKILE